MTDVTQDADSPIGAPFPDLPRFYESCALRVNTRSLLNVGYKIREDGLPIGKPLRGNGGRSKTLRSPLVGMLRRKYPSSSKRNLKALLAMGRTDWDRLELSMQALGITVFCSPLANSTLQFDTAAIEAFDDYKCFWVNYALKGARVTRSDEGGNHVALPNLPKAIDGLKTLAAWCRWHAADFNNVKPKLLVEWPGCDFQRQVNRLAWFGGSLASLADPSGATELIPALCQAATFGRALPPAFGQTLIDAGRECLKVLTTPYTTDPDTLILYEGICSELGASLPKVGYSTHCSVSKTASLGMSSEHGGKAGELCPAVAQLVESTAAWLRPVDLSIQDPYTPLGMPNPCQLGLMLNGMLGKSNHTVYDCYGRVFAHTDPIGRVRMYPKDDRLDALYQSGLLQGLTVTGMKITTMLWSLYCWPDDYNVLQPETNELWLNRTTVLFLEQVCFSSLCKEGIIRFDKDPDLWVGNFSWEDSKHVPGIPVWFTPGRRTIVPLARIPVRFKTLGEPGHKARPLTIGHASVNCLMQLVRFLVEPVFHHDPRCKIGFEEPHVLWNFLKRLEKRMKGFSKHPLFINSDFKAATDYIPLDLLEAMWNGFWQGQNLKPDHPIWVIWPLIFHKRVILGPDIYDVERPWLQERGSFMGEPCSFLTLTLFNLATVCLAQEQAKDPERPLKFYDLDQDSVQLTVPCQIVGDDLLAVAGPTFDHAHKELVRKTGMVFSPGKDLRSRKLLILCEDVAVYDDEKKSISFVDVVKARLLTRMTRIHSDNRCAVLGKGSQVSTYTSWNENPWVVLSTKSVYMDTFRKVLTSKKFLSSRFPLEVSPYLGGISLPDRTFEQFKEKCSFVLRVFEWIIKLPIGEFLFWMSQIRQLNGRIKKGVEAAVRPEDLSKIFKTYVFQTRDETELKAKVIYRRDFVIRYLEEKGIEVPISPYSGQPINTVVLNEARKLCLIPLNNVIDDLERIRAFAALFKDPTAAPLKLSFARYQRRLHTLWTKVFGGMETRGEFAYGGLPLEPKRWRSFDHMNRDFTMRLSNFVLSTEESLWFFQSGPSLRISYRPVTTVE